MRPAAGFNPDSSTPRWLTRVWNAPWPWMALVVALFCVPLFVGLDRQDYENDEAIYSFSVDVILKSGDWLTPKTIPSETFAFLEKPPLKFWIVALPIHWGLLPANEFGMRFWDAVMGGIAFLYVLAIGRRLAGPICGLTAVFLLFAHGPLILEHGLRTNNMEAAVLLTYAAGMYHWLAWRSAGPDDRGHIFAIALYFVLGFMTKFVAALFLPLVIGIAALLKPEDRFRLRMNWPTFALAGLLAIGLIAPWFVYQYVARPSELFETMLGQHVLKRFTSYLDPAHVHPWNYYFTRIWSELRTSGSAALTLAGAVLLIAHTIRRRWLEGALVVLWFAIPMALISMGTSKLYHYAYPFLPPVALAGGYAVAIVASVGWRWLRRPAEILVEIRDSRMPRFLRAAPARWALITLGVAAMAIAITTALRARINVAVGETVLLRNSSQWRPVVVGALALLAGARAAAIRTIVPIILVLGLLPFSAYRATITRAETPAHPLRDMRACLTRIVDQLVAQGRKPPGVWVEGRTYSHVYRYYLSSLGPFQEVDVPSDSTVAMHLFVPAFYRPVLLTNERYGQFFTHLIGNRARVLEQSARQARLDPEVVLDGYQRTALGVIPYAAAKLLLPGPYRVCASERLDVVSR